MSTIATKSYLKIIATMAAAMANCTAAALTEQSAAFVSFQRQQPSLLPFKNANLAGFSRTSRQSFRRE